MKATWKWAAIGVLWSTHSEIDGWWLSLVFRRDLFAESYCQHQFTISRTESVLHDIVNGVLESVVSCNLCGSR